MINDYGSGDSSFLAAGGYEGIRKLVVDFYDYMASLPEARAICKMHPQDIESSRDKLTRFLCGWLGGPKLYQEKFGPIRIPMAHIHLPIGVAERDAWLLCMQKALEDQPYEQAFREYLIKQLYVPAERIREVGAARRQQSRD